MAEEKSNKIITILLAVVITIAAIAIIYVNLPQEKNDENITNDDVTDDNTDDGTDENNNPPATIIFTVTYNDEILSYTLEELENLEAYTGSGSYVKTKLLPETVLINGPYSFTGIKFTTILDEFNSLPEDYNITVTASDGYPSSFTKDQAYGVVDIYTETGDVTGTSGATMILAYKEDGEYITDEEIGPLRVAFVGDDIVTASNIWSKMVVSIEITEI